MPKIKFHDGTVHHISRGRKRRYEALRERLEYRCPDMDPTLLDTAAYVNVHAGIAVGRRSEPCIYREFYDKHDYRIPADPAWIVASHCRKDNIVVNYIAEHYTRKEQKEIIRFMMESGYPYGSETYFLWLHVPHARSVMLDYFERIHDLDKITLPALVRVLVPRKRSSPWSGRIKRLILDWEAMIPKSYSRWTIAFPTDGINALYEEIFNAADKVRELFEERKD